MKSYRILLYAILSFCCFSCVKKISIIENSSFLSVSEDSRQSGKPIFLMIGGGHNCLPCTKLKRDIRNSKLLTKYKDSFLFYSCNVNLPQNKFLQKVLLPVTVPNYYLIDSKGSVLSFSFYPLDDERIDYELAAFLNGNILQYEKHPVFRFDTDSLLHMQSLLLQANLKILSEEYQSALQLVNKSIELHPYFYNSFLKYKICSKSEEDTLHIDSLVRIAYQYLSANEKQSSLFDEDIKELEIKIPALKEQKSTIEIAESEIDCGKIKADSKQTFRIKFSNSGNYPIVLLNVTSSCGCLEPHWPTKPILSNDTSSISISFHADAYGKFEQKIKIYSNAVNSPNTIKLSGIIH